MNHRSLLLRPLLTAAVAILSTAIYTGCDSAEPTFLRDSLDVPLQVNECHEQDLGFYGSDAEAVVTRPPRRAESGALVRETSGMIRYRYCPTRSFIGTDSVVILISHSLGREEKTIRYRMSK